MKINFSILGVVFLLCCVCTTSIIIENINLKEALEIKETEYIFHASTAKNLDISPTDSIEDVDKKLQDISAEIYSDMTDTVRELEKVGKVSNLYTCADLEGGKITPITDIENLPESAIYKVTIVTQNPSIAIERCLDNLDIIYNMNYVSPVLEVTFSGRKEVKDD